MKKTTATFILTVSLGLLASCGKHSSGGGGNVTSSRPALEELSSEGFYRAILRPFNNQLSGFLPTGFADITIQGDSVQVKTLLDDDARVPHLQSIHMGTRCPTAADDRNGDGLVDIQEAVIASGEAFIPLDGDINSAAAGAGIYPMGGGFTYTRTGSLALMESDARARTGQNLNLGGRVVIIHGVAATTKIPATLATRDGLTPQAAAPIACGVLKRMAQ